MAETQTNPWISSTTSMSTGNVDLDDLLTADNPNTGFNRYRPTAMVANPGTEFDTNQYNNLFNDYQATKSRQFDYIMSSTAYQRGMKDLKAAGINPYAAYTSLNSASASTPSSSGASAGSSSGSGGNVVKDILSSIFGIALLATKL